MTDCVQVHEVGPRDGLQNEPGIIAVADKLALIAALADAGLFDIEVGSFVSPKWVPQMADSDKVLAGLASGPRYDVLVPNIKGWNTFADAQKPVDTGIAVFVSASEGFSHANLNCTIAESIARLTPVVQAARHLGVRVRGYVSCITDCPFDGPTSPGQVARVVQELRDVAPMQVSLGDTIGKGTPDRISTMLDAVTDVAPVKVLAGHFHDTGGQALANVAVSLEKGLRVFDAAAGGLGGCPYAPGAPGNLATEALIGMLHDTGFVTGVDPQKLAQAVTMAKAMKGSGNAKPIG